MERGKMILGKSIGTFTFCECAENHAGMQQIGVKGVKGSGFSVAELAAIQARFAAVGKETEMVSLGGEGSAFPEAAVLVIRDNSIIAIESPTGVPVFSIDSIE